MSTRLKHCLSDISQKPAVWLEAAKKGGPGLQNRGKEPLNLTTTSIINRPSRAKKVGMSSTGPPFIPQIRYNLTQGGDRMTKLFYTDVN